MSGMYNSHRGMVPAPSRLNELLDQVRAEFESQQARNGEYEHKSTPLFLMFCRFPLSLSIELSLAAHPSTVRQATDCLTRVLLS
jgi:hypothetical protein